MAVKLKKGWRLKCLMMALATILQVPCKDKNLLLQHSNEKYGLNIKPIMGAWNTCLDIKQK